MTVFFRRLADLAVHSHDARTPSADDLIEHFSDAYYVSEQLNDEYKIKLNTWITQYRVRVNNDRTPDALRREKMNKVNPKYIFRNYIAQLAIDKAEQGDSSMVNELLEVLRNPYDEQTAKEEFSKRRPEWARHRAGCAMLS